MAIRDVINDNPEADNEQVLDMEALLEKYKDDPEMLRLLEYMNIVANDENQSLTFEIQGVKELFNKKAHLLADEIKKHPIYGNDNVFKGHLISFTDADGNQSKKQYLYQALAELKADNQTIQPEPNPSGDAKQKNTNASEEQSAKQSNAELTNVASLGLGLGSILGGLKGIGTSSVNAAANLSKVVGNSSVNASKNAVGSMQEWRANRKINAINEAKATAAKLKSNLDVFRSDPEYTALEKKAFQRNQWDEGLSNELNNLLDRKPEMRQHIQTLNSQSTALVALSKKAIELNKDDKEGVVNIYDELDEELADVSVRSGMVPAVLEAGQVKSTVFDNTEKSRQDLRSLIERVAEIVTRIKNFFGVGNYDKANPKEVTNLLPSPAAAPRM